MEKRGYQAMRAYGDTKLATLYFTYDLVRRCKRHNVGVIATGAHPGHTATELQRHTVMKILNVFGMDIEQGVLPTLRAVTEPGLKGGEFFGLRRFYRSLWISCASRIERIERRSDRRTAPGRIEKIIRR